MKKSILFSILLGGITQVYSLDLEHLPPMPMPTQYNNVELYHQALHTWEKVTKKVLACSPHIQWPPMPLPTQYLHLNLYQQALEIWKTMRQVPRKDCAGNIVDVVPMPMPTQYRNLEFYQQALTVWEKVYTQSVDCHVNVQLPPLPKLTQYNHLDFYQQALKAWEKAGSCQ